MSSRSPRSKPDPREVHGQAPSTPMPSPTVPPATSSPATRLQRWCAVGLTPMHEATVHRLVVHHLSQHHLAVQWQSFAQWEDLPVDLPVGLNGVGLNGDGLNGDDPSAKFTYPSCRFDAWESPKMADVIIIEVDQLRRMCGEMVTNLSRLPSPSSSDPCIRLVWSWGTLGHLESLETADCIVPMASLAHGLIHNAVTLNGWIRSAAAHARNHPSPPHPLLQNLSIPSLVLQ